MRPGDPGRDEHPGETFLCQHSFHDPTSEETEARWTDEDIERAARVLDPAAFSGTVHGVRMAEELQEDAREQVAVVIEALGAVPVALLDAERREHDFDVNVAMAELREDLDAARARLFELRWLISSPGCWMTYDDMRHEALRILDGEAS